jgi:hypothetical protein
MLSNKTDENSWRVVPASIVAGIMFLFLSVSIVSQAMKHSDAISCTGAPNVPQTEQVSGVITTRASVKETWYISTGSEQRVVYRCYRGRCGLFLRLNNAVNQPATATFCQGILLKLDVRHENLITYQITWSDIYVTALVYLGIVASIFVLIRYGYKVPLISLFVSSSAESDSTAVKNQSAKK